MNYADRHSQGRLRDVAKDVRARMVDAAVRLLATKGLEGTSFAEVLELSGAPRGSIYHHFPGGKDELVTEAVAVARERAIAYLEEQAGKRPREIAAAFLALWRSVLTGSDLGAGCAVLAVTVATDDEELLARTAEVFRSWRSRLAALLADAGLPADVATRYAAALIASSEGAVVMARAEQSMEPFDLVAEQLLVQLTP
jgi:TetR/AcrR family transcriptional repressor of lmrAB and yxaGH operons